MILVLTSKELQKEALEKALDGSRAPRAVKPSYAAGISYNAELQRMLRELQNDIRTQLIPVIRTDEPEYAADSWSEDIASVFKRLIEKWSSSLFGQWSQNIASKFVNRAADVGRRKFARSAPGISVNLYGEVPEINDYLAAATRANVGLIESIPRQHLEKIEIMIMSQMRSGVRSGAITRQLVEQFGVTKSRAKFIARDQTSKINADITKKRQLNAGFEYFRWIESKDNRVRDRHRAIAMRDVGYGPGVYKWSDLPLSDSGDRISPGVDYQCRCTASPLTQKMVDRIKSS